MRQPDEARRDVDRLAAVTAATGGVLSAAAATCCVLPLALAIVGLGGGWLVVFGPLVAHRPLVLAAAAVPLALAWWRFAGGCGRRRAVLAVTAAATVLWLAALAAPWWEAPATGALWRLWSTT